MERTKLEPSSLLHSSQPPHVVAVEVQSNRENVQKRSKSTGKGEKVSYGSTRPSRCSSVEGCRTVSSAGQIQSKYDVEESPPTFKPTLAPRSEKLVSQDPQRCQTPTYVRLHAQTMKRMSEHNKTTTTITKPSSSLKVKDDYSGKPRILSRSREKVSQEPVGNRLYEQAIAQQRRLEEKRLKEQQKREEEEWRSLLAVPQINKEKKRRSCDIDKDQTNSIHLHNTSVPSRSLLQQQRHNTIKEKVKPYKERELEACTFVPAVNPASLRMFNMVVRGQIAESTGMMSSREASRSNNNNDEDNNDNNKHREVLSVEERLLLHEEKRRKRLEDERHFREKFDAATGRPLFRPFLGR
ncbi:hypothetical protein LSM04_002834 [Trypanosoma melophagium]|nr:hypothetical protein LSM04_002834 [Trypanosoma melophagium]